jgi:uncharacterized membrane protein
MQRGDAAVVAANRHGVAPSDRTSVATQGPAVSRPEAHLQGDHRLNTNPYEAPRADVADYEPPRMQDTALASPRSRPAGNGVAWISEAWWFFRQAPGLWIGMFVVMMAVMMVSGLVPIAGFLVSCLATPLLWAGMMVGCDAQRRGEPLQFEHLFAAFSRNTGQLLLAGVLYAVALIVVMLVAFVPLLGMAASMGFMAGDVEMLAEGGESLILMFLLAMLIYMALVVPLVMAMWFSPALIMLDDKPALEAIKLSFLGCLKNIVPFLLYGLVGMALAIAATLPLLLGWLVLGPLMYITSYTAYRDIFFARD